jgi:hypothetical protein
MKRKKKMLKRSGAFAMGTLMALTSVPVPAFAANLEGTNVLGEEIDYEHGSGFFAFTENYALSSAFSSDWTFSGNTYNDYYKSIPARGGKTPIVI